jgi:hypothetical protein
MKTAVCNSQLTVFVCSVQHTELTPREVALVLSAGKNPAHWYITTATDLYEPGNTLQYYIIAIL